MTLWQEWSKSANSSSLNVLSLEISSSISRSLASAWGTFAISSNVFGIFVCTTRQNFVSAAVVRDEKARAREPRVIVALAVVSGLNRHVVRLALDGDERLLLSAFSFAAPQMTKSARACPAPRPVTSASSAICSSAKPYSFTKTQRYSCRTRSSGVSSSHFGRS